jgi:hypothetical protein
MRSSRSDDNPTCSGFGVEDRGVRRGIRLTRFTASRYAWATDVSRGFAIGRHAIAV